MKKARCSSSRFFYTLFQSKKNNGPPKGPVTLQNSLVKSISENDLFLRRLLF